MTKTYTTTIEKPRLEVWYDQHCESPRSDTNLGYFITCEQRYMSPDRNEDMEFIVRETSEMASNQEEHIKLIAERFADDLDEQVLWIYPICRYEHSAVKYYRGTGKGFDSSNCGFYIITAESLKEYGEHSKPIEALIDGELEAYTAYANGEVYGFTEYNDKGEMIESVGGFYELDDMKDYLGKEWKDENLYDYIKH